MADFRTHFTASTMVGVGCAVLGHTQGIPLIPCILGGGLCAVAGILPDLDSDSGVPFRESVAFVSAFVPLLLIQRFQHLGWSRETIVLAAALIYIGIRFGVAEIFRRYTVHRGMWHSIPAAASVGLLTFLITDDQNVRLRLFWAACAVIGFVTHLVLDEVYSVNFLGVRLKKSFGTALKFWTNRGIWPNVSTYGKLAILAALAWGDPMLMEHVHERFPDSPRTANQRETIPAPPIQRDGGGLLR
ncbi:MAG: metal-dependent hydrolase [Planctomycetes bacterium]|nr:metal-dependent hydrolase [Planctomycetota bacterium]